MKMGPSILEKLEKLLELYEEDKELATELWPHHSFEEDYSHDHNLKFILLHAIQLQEQYFQDGILKKKRLLEDKKITRAENTSQN